MDDRGLSLVETMVTLVVIVVGLAAVQRIFPQELATGRHALERTQATMLARGKLAQLRLQGFEALTVAAHQVASPEPFRDSQHQVVFPRFRWQVETIRRAADVVEVQVQVMWPWPRQTHRVHFATYVSQR